MIYLKNKETGKYLQNTAGYNSRKPIWGWADNKHTFGVIRLPDLVFAKIWLKRQKITDDIIFE